MVSTDFHVSMQSLGIIITQLFLDPLKWAQMW